MIKRHPVYPYDTCHNGVIRETGFADGAASYDTLFVIIFPTIFNYDRVSAPEKWECADSNS